MVGSSASAVVCLEEGIVFLDEKQACLGGLSASRTAAGAGPAVVQEEVTEGSIAAEIAGREEARRADREERDETTEGEDSDSFVTTGLKKGKCMKH